MAWKQDSGATNCKRMAFIFDYYGTEVYKRAVCATHQDVTAKHVLAQLGIQIDKPSAEMRGGQKNCVQQQYSAASKTKKNNILCVGTKAHRVRVNREQGKHSSAKPNWKRPKEVFFNSTNDPSKPSCKIVTKVSGHCWWENNVCVKRCLYTMANSKPVVLHSWTMPMIHNGSSGCRPVFNM
jgi:hypothetical protein